MQNISSVWSIMFRRCASFLYDCLLLVALYFIITAVAIGFNDGEAIQHFLFHVFLLVIGFMFFDWFWRHGGQTLGMRAWRIRVEGFNSETITFKQSATRFILGVLLFGISILCMPFTAQKLALHDKLSKTKIVKYYK